MGLFDVDHEKYQAQYKAAIDEKLPGEQVLATGIFFTSGSYGAMALSQVSGIAYMAARALGKKQAGGLSQNSC